MVRTLCDKDAAVTPPGAESFAPVDSEMVLAPPDEILVDARGHRCPVPTLRLRRAMEAAGPGGRVRLLADDPLARIDVPHLAASQGWTVLETQIEGATLRFLVQA